jgi:chromosome segregation ATPase
MRNSITTFRATFPAILASAAFVTIGCAERTTRQDVADARDALEQAQEETAEAARQARQDVAEAERDAERHTVNKPVLDDRTGLASENIADAELAADAAVREELQEEREAAAELRITEQEHQATRARDAYVKEVEQKLAELNGQIHELQDRATDAEADAKDAINKQVASLENQHDQVEEALEDLKTADLAHWQVHQENVRLAIQDLTSSLDNVR